MTATAAALGSAPPSSAPGSPVGPGRPRRGARWALAVVGAVAVVALAVLGLSQLGGGRAPGPTTVDASVDPDGLRAFVLLLASFDAEVVVGPDTLLVPQDEGGPPGPPVDAVLVLGEVDVDEEGRQRLLAFAEAGGTVVEVAPGPGRLGAPGLPPEASVVLRGCDLPALADVERVVTLVGDPVARGGVAVTAGCFDGQDGPLLLADRLGAGTWIELGTARPFTNRFLAEEDDAVLATSLFAPVPGRRVLLLTGTAGLPAGVGGGEPGQGGTGRDGLGGDPGDDPSSDPTDPADGGTDDQTLADLVPTGVTLALLQVLLAGVVYALWRGRRVGAPVREPQPVSLAASELTRAVGGLLARTGDPARAAGLLRDDATRQLARTLGLPTGTDAEAVAEAVAARTGHAVDRARWALAGPDPTDEDGLLRLAVELDALRQEVAHGVPA